MMSRNEDMNNQILNEIVQPINNLINKLDKEKILDDLSLNDEDIADAIWLVLQMGVNQPIHSSLAPAPIKKKPEDISVKDKKGGLQIEPEKRIIFDEDERFDAKMLTDDSLLEKYTVVEDFVKYKKPSGETPKDRDEPKIEGLKKDPDGPKKGPGEQKEEPDELDMYLENLKPNFLKSFLLRVPAAPTIQNSLSITRSLMSLKHKVSSRTDWVLDEEATVNRIIEGKIWQPVIKYQHEKWLDLEIIIEESSSSFIWRQFINEFQKLLENQRIFRNVRTWTIKQESSNLVFTYGNKIGKFLFNKCSPKELILDKKQGLILLISDCVSPIWKDSHFLNLVKNWSMVKHTAIVQFFPESLWERTYLSNGKKLFGKALNPGVPNNQLILDYSFSDSEINPKKSLIIPVVNIEPKILSSWARVVCGLKDAQISTYLFDLEFLKAELRETKTLASEQGKETNAEIIIQRFISQASPITQKLAGMIAAVPIDIDIINLIRRTSCKEAQPMHVAEFFMNGLVHITNKDSNKRSVEYDFVPGVRKLINQYLGQETIKVLDAISNYIGDQIDKPELTFWGLIGELPEIIKKEGKILPFARIGIDVLKNIGVPRNEIIERVIPPAQKLKAPDEERYTKLETLLKAQDFKAADEETDSVMLAVANRQSEGYLRVEDAENFPCKELRTIDNLWLKYSQGKFGISVQQEIYKNLGGTKQFDEKVWESFGDRVGWRKQGWGWRKQGSWLYYKDLNFSLSAPTGQLPAAYVVRVVVGGDFSLRTWYVGCLVYFPPVKTCRV